MLITQGGGEEEEEGGGGGRKGGALQGRLRGGEPRDAQGVAEKA